MNFLKKIFRKKESQKPEEKTAEITAPVETISGDESKEIKYGSILGVIEYPRVTEKTSDASGMNKFVFAVRRGANKPEIKGAVESRYGVRVTSVNVLNSQGKEHTRGKQKGWKPGFKKAVVTLKEGQTIEIQ